MAGPDEKLKRESTSIVTGQHPRRDPDTASAPIVTLTDHFNRLDEARQEYLLRSFKVLDAVAAHPEVATDAAKYKVQLEAEKQRLEEEAKEHLAWGAQLLGKIKAEREENEEVAGEPKSTTLTPEAVQGTADDQVVAMKVLEERPRPASVAVAVAEPGPAATEVSPKEQIPPSPTRSSKRRTFRGNVAAFMKKLAVRYTLYTCLAIALFGPGLMTLTNVPDDPGVLILDIVMSIVGVAFALEVAGLLLVDEFYRYSFFFAMDLLGTLSMAFEISFLLGQYLNSNTVVLRTARTAKLGARIGRLIKLVKCVSMFYRSSAKTTRVEAKVLASKLVVLLSTRVSVIVIVMVIVVPLSSLPLYPTEDLSMGLWPTQLEDSYWHQQDYNVSGALQRELDQMVQSYSEVSYHPYLVQGFGPDIQLADGPVRQGNSLKVSSEDCLVSRAPSQCMVKVLFDFTGPSQTDALVEVCTIFFIILLMALTSFDLQAVVDYNLVKPLEGMLQHVREHAAHIFDKMSKQKDKEMTDLDQDQDLKTQVHGASEIELIQAILEKLARLATLADNNMNAMTTAELDAMNAESKAVLLDMLNVQVLPTRVDGKLARRATETDAQASWTQSWDLNVLKSSKEELHGYVHYLFFHSQFGVAYQFASEEVFAQFVHTVELGYKDVPYHCYAHGVDVLFTVFRLMQLSGATKWTSEIEQYAMLVASLCHDLGHFGRTNQFLVETKHELALRYNDKSPLENMHCAALFQICQHANQNLFAQASADEQKEARKVAIAAILHTDNAHHFEMVKDVSAVYEMESETCDAQAMTPEVMMPSYRDKVLMGKNKLMWLQLFLHFADVSNPLKPFEICRAWAWRVLDEFFEQGDEEKSLGVPVGMLNDRDKVNRPGSQHGFINFLVAPFVAASVRVFPIFQPLHGQMIRNLEEWRNLWIEDAMPSDEDIAKKDADVSKLKALDLDLAARKS